MFEIIFLISISLYFTLLVVLALGTTKTYPKLAESDLPTVSIIVAARNEEHNILDCLKSLAQLEYPEGKLEIIIVDDSSVDDTGKIITNFIEGRSNFTKITTGRSIGNLRGKANAIANAVEISKGEIIITTDADCTVAPAWAKTIASYYQDDVAFVGGYTTQEDDTAFHGMQAVDFIFLLTVAAGGMNLGKPLSCIGNNMSYRKSAYDEAGGYEKILFSVTEDFQVLMAIYNLKKYRIIYPLDVGALVTSKPCPDFRSLYKQKKRWGVGGLKSDISSFGVMVIAYFANLGLLLLPFF
ncbi:glycosyltransferase, partial [Bacteroidota bacterium]